MKNNLISAIAGWKSAALLALVAMVAAVAFSGVFTSTESADAQTGGDPQDTVAGGTVTVSFTGVGSTEIRFRIDPASEATGSFTANGAQNIRCTDNVPTCDVDTTDGTIGLRVTVDEDSPAPGSIYVQTVTRSDNVFAPGVEVEIRVAQPDPLTAISLAGAPPAPISHNPADADAPRTITVKATKANGFGISAQSLTVITTRGVLAVTTDGDCEAPATIDAATSSRGSCSVTTAEDDAGTPADEAGTATVALFGNGASGVATLTFLHAATGTTFSQDVVLYGAVGSISAETQQSAVGVGGTTFIVVTVLDTGGNPVAGASVNTDTGDVLTQGIVGPGAPPSQVKIRTRNNTDYTADPRGARFYIPACGDDTTSAFPAADGTPNDGGRFTAGTNAAGKCVIQVGAPNGPAPFDASGTDGEATAMNPADDATRGTHTVTIKAADLALPSQKVSVDIEVGGAPSTMESDAPASVEPLSTTAITVTVSDDEGVRVGAVPISVVQVQGSGNLDAFPNQAAEAGASTSDGRATFTYLAPLSGGDAVFLIRAGHPGAMIQETITVSVGDAAEEDPEAPAATWNNELVSGQNVVVWNGDDGADASAGSADGVTAIWSYNTGSGSWDGYFPEAADVPGGNTLTSLSSNQAYVVIVN